ncbi:MAG: hypothetical protein FJ320_04665 [SAR202 cluster bacterium]|nr:hypothetical protein [SAR202 cluster bacterium]
MTGKLGHITFISIILLAGGTTLTVVGSQQEMSLLVGAGVGLIIAGLWLLRPLAQEVIEWLDRRRL